MYIEIKKYIDDDAKNFWVTQEKAQNLNLFQTYLWNSKVLKYFFQHNSDDLRIFTVKEKNEIIAIFPLYIKKKFIFNILSLIGDDFTDYNSPIFKKEIINNNDKINKIFNEIKLLDGKFDLICFKNQIDDIIFSINPIVNFFRSKKTQLTYAIKMHSNLENYIKNKNLINLEKRINYNLRKLNLDIKKNFKIVNNLSKKKKLILETIENKKNLSIFLDYEKVCNFFLDDQILKYLHCSAIYSNNGQLLASNIGILEKKKFIYYFPSYAKLDFIKKYSPGTILIYCLIRYFFKANIDYFDFGIGNEEYKIKWSNISFETKEYSYVHSKKGHIFYFFKKNLT